MYDKEANDIKKIVYFYVMWKELKATQNVKWRQLTSFFDDNNFDEAIQKIINKFYTNGNQLELELPAFMNNNIEKIKVKTEIFCEKLKKAKIGGIIRDNFKKYNALKRIKNAYFLFFKGNEEILMEKIDKFVSVVGSRKTPQHYSSWISNYVPKDRIIVSGLANGADLMGHLDAIANGQRIVVFPGTDLLFPPRNNANKRKVWNYALENGIILSDIIPQTKSFDQNVFLKRNKWMAQMVNETYAVYFDGISGTLGQLLEVAGNQNGKIYMPKEVLTRNRNFLQNHQKFNKILEKVKVMPNEIIEIF